MGFIHEPYISPLLASLDFRIGLWRSLSILLKWIPGNSWQWAHIHERIVSDWHTLMNSICDVLEMKIIAHYLLVPNKCSFEAALNWTFFTIICLVHGAACETQATQGHLWNVQAIRPHDCPLSLHNREPLPGALQSFGSQAELFYLLSTIQMSAPQWGRFYLESAGLLHCAWAITSLREAKLQWDTHELPGNLTAQSLLDLLELAASWAVSVRTGDLRLHQIPTPSFPSHPWIELFSP